MVSRMGMPYREATSSTVGELRPGGWNRAGGRACWSRAYWRVRRDLEGHRYTCGGPAILFPPRGPNPDGGAARTKKKKRGKKKEKVTPKKSLGDRPKKRGGAGFKTADAFVRMELPQVKFLSHISLFPFLLLLGILRYIVIISNLSRRCPRRFVALCVLPLCHLESPRTRIPPYPPFPP